MSSFDLVIVTFLFSATFYLAKTIKQSVSLVKKKELDLMVMLQFISYFFTFSAYCE